MVCRPAPPSASMKVMRSATLTDVFSFCSPSRGPTSTMRTESVMLISRRCRLDLGEFEPFADNIANLAFYRLQYAGKRSAQGLLHLHHLKGQDRGALLQRGPDLGQQRYHCAGQRRDDLVFTNLLFVIAAERIYPMQIEAAIARPKIQLVAFDDRDNMVFHPVKRQIKPAIVRSGRRKSYFLAIHRKSFGSPAIVEFYVLFGGLSLTESEKPLPPAHRRPTRTPPRRA